MNTFAGLSSIFSKKVSLIAVIAGAIPVAVFMIGSGSHFLHADTVNCDSAPSVATLNPFPLKFHDNEVCKDYPVVAARLANGSWPQNISELINGINAQAVDEIVVRIYIHDGAVTNGDPAVTTARNIKVRTTVDGSTGSFHSIDVIAASDNTNTIQGNFSIHTGPNDRLVVVPGSGQLFDYVANPVSSGLNIANATYNLGDMQACFQFSQFLVFRVRVETTAPVLQPSGHITAQPNPCTITQAAGTCTSNITWTTTNVSRAQVWVSRSGGGEKIFVDQISCSGTSCPAPWIQGPPDFYDFNLYDYSSGTRGVKLDSVRVTAVLQIPSIPPTVGPLVCNFTWSSPTTAEGTVLRKIGEASNVNMLISGATPQGVVLVKNTNLNNGIQVVRQVQADANGSFSKSDSTSVSASEGYSVGNYKTELVDLGTNNVTSCKSFIVQQQAQAAQTLNVVLTAATNSVNFSKSVSGTAPLNGVDLKADVGGTATGTINYTFYCNRSDVGINVTGNFNAKFDNTNDNPKIVNNVCNYPASGTFVAKVIAERGGLVAEDRVVITVVPASTSAVVCSPSSQTVNINQTATFAAAGGDGNFSWSAPGASITSGSGSVFSTNFASAGSRNVTVTSAGQTSTCVISVNQSQVINPPTVDLKVNGSDGPITINNGSSATLTWISNNTTACSASASPVSSTWTGSKAINNTSGESTGSLNQNTVFAITCTGSGGSASDSVIVLVTGFTQTNQFFGVLSCNPSFQTVNVNQSAFFVANGGNGNYTWIANAGGSPSLGSGTSFATLFNTPGFRTVTLTSGDGQSVGCSVQVTGQTQFINFGVNNFALSVQKFGKNITKGESADQSSVNANPGDTVEFVIRIQSLANTTVNNVFVQDILPSGLNFISRSTSVDGTIVSDGIVGGISVGSLSIGQTRIVRLDIQVADQSFFGLGTNTLINTAQVSAANVSTQTAQVQVNVFKGKVPSVGIVSRVPTGSETVFGAAFISAVLSLLLVFYGQTYFAQRRQASKVIKRHLNDKNKFNFA